MSRKYIKVLIAKPGLDGHESGAKVVARALADAGMEVVYTGTRQTPKMIVKSAIQEDVDVLGLSILSGAHLQLCPRILALLKEEGNGELPVIVGGIIPDSDIPALKSLGIKEVFGPGCKTSSIVQCIQDLTSKKEAKENVTDER